MSVRIIKSLVLIWLFLVPSLSFAQVSVNEVMYDLPGTDSGREWVELYNNGANAVDLNGWKFLESTSASNHVITSVQGSSTLGPGEYGVLVIDQTKFLADWPSYSGNIFKAAFSSLNNSGGTLILKDSTGAQINQIVYDSSMGAAGDGNTLQESGGSLVAAFPTPGQPNASVSVLPVQTNATTTTTQQTQTSATNNQMSTAQQNVVATLSTHYSYLPLSDYDAIQNLKVGAGRDRLAAIGNPIEFKAESNSDNGSITYTWAFGDGETGTGDHILHTYLYPGQYVVVLTAATPVNEKAISRTTVTVVDPKLNIEEANSNFIRIKNNSSKEVSLYGWKISASGSTFAFPQDTILLPNSAVAFAQSTTHLMPGNSKGVSISMDQQLPTEKPDSSKLTNTERETLIKQLLVLQSEALALTKRQPIRSLGDLQVAAPIKAFSITSASTSSTTMMNLTPSPKVGWLTSLKHFFGMR